MKKKIIASLGIFVFFIICFFYFKTEYRIVSGIYTARYWKNGKEHLIKNTQESLNLVQKEENQKEIARRSRVPISFIKSNVKFWISNDRRMLYFELLGSDFKKVRKAADIVREVTKKIQEDIYEAKYEDILLHCPKCQIEDGKLTKFWFFEETRNTKIVKGFFILLGFLITVFGLGNKVFL